MTGDHYVLLEGDAGQIAATFICEAPPGAPCRMMPDCECEVWHEDECEERYPDGPPMKAVDYCNPKEYIDGEGAQWAASSGKVRVPVTTDWDRLSETYVYDFDGEAQR